MSISSKLPSKKIQALIIVVFALFVTYFLYTLNVKDMVASWFAQSKTHYDLTVATSTTDASNIDSDGDGLKDWQEALWGTDPHNPDTDGDGTPDGEEVAEGRDPLVAGPNDKLVDTRGIASSSVATFSASVSDDPNNLSTSFSKDFFSKFMALQTSGELTSQSEQDLINQSISDIDPGSLPPKYTINDVKAVATTNDSLKTYGNQVAQLVTTFQSSIQNESDNNQALASYADFIDNLKNIPAPTLLAFNHLQILNNFNVSYITLQYLIDYQGDPLKGLSALKTMQTNSDNAVTLYSNIAASMQKNGIIFNQSDPGSIWKNYY
jgi:hypothetical protein